MSWCMRGLSRGVVLAAVLVHASATPPAPYTAATAPKSLVAASYVHGVQWPPMNTPLSLSESFTVRAGYLSSGDDLIVGNFTVADAEATCLATPQCVGFTFQAADANPTGAVQMWLKSADFFTPASGWFTYTIAPPPAWPDRNFTAGGLNVGLRSATHSVQVLGIVDENWPPNNFSFVPPLSNPGLQRPDRSAPGCHQLGDITLRLQPAGWPNASAWALFSSVWADARNPSGARAIPLNVSTLPAYVVAADDITPLLNATPSAVQLQNFSLSVRVMRSYEIHDDVLVLSYNITALEDTVLGGLGLSMPADFFVWNLDLPHIAYINSFVDPYIGGDWGYAEWTRIVGNTTLIVSPHVYDAATVGTHTSYTSDGVKHRKVRGDGAGVADIRPSMEAWRPLLDDCTFDGQLSEWTILTAAWATEWQGNRQAPVLSMPPDLQAMGVWPNPATPWPCWEGNGTAQVADMPQKYWHPPSQIALAAGQGVRFALRFALTASGPRSRDAALLAQGSPVVRGVPGYTLGRDMNSTALLIALPAGLSVANISASPDGYLVFGGGQRLPSGELEYLVGIDVSVPPAIHQRVRVIVGFSDGSEASVHYHILPTFPTQIANLGVHWANASWLPREFKDPFGRSASVMPYNRELQTIALDDSRAYVVGLSDDAGGGNNAGAGTKNSYAPTAYGVARLDDYIDFTLTGVKPDTAQPPLRSLQTGNQIRMTMYYYCNTPGNCTSADGHFPYDYPEQSKCFAPVGGPVWCMTEAYANYTYRGYNVPHQTAVWYAMYRVARFYDRLGARQPWQAYLEQAAQLIIGLGTPNVGFMEGTVFREVLWALQAEGTDNATFLGLAQQVDSLQQQRADYWNQQPYAWNSEFSYDTTSQEEIGVWLLHYFGLNRAANETVDAILAYMRNVPNWAYHGGATSLGDIGNNGYFMVNRGSERMLQHYRAGLNAIPLFEAFRMNPDDTFLLRTAIGANGGQLTNIDLTGATSMGFHSFPFLLDHDARSGDYGLGFFGLSVEAAAYVLRDADGSSTGWACYFCNLVGSPTPTSITWANTDAYRIRSYLEPLGLFLVAHSGTLTGGTLDLAAQRITLVFAPAASTPAGLQGYSSLWLELRKEAALRPGTTWQVTAGGSPCPLVRGKYYQIPPASSVTDSTTVVITYS